MVAAVSHSLDPGPLVRLWRLDRDKVVAVVAAVGVVVAGVVNGMLVAIGLSLVVLIRRLASPAIVQLGRLGDSHAFVDVSRHAEARPIAGVAIWRPAEPLFFANADRILAAVEREVAADPSLRVVILSLEESFDLDSTSLDSLLEFEARLAARGLAPTLARTRDPIRDLLARAGAASLLGRLAYSVDDAVTRVGARERPQDGSGEASSGDRRAP